MNARSEIFRDDFHLDSAIQVTKDRGYFFGYGALTEEAQVGLEYEIGSLPLKVVDESKKHIVPQRFERFYTEYGDEQSNAANFVIDGLVRAVQALDDFPELEHWHPNEIGYQRYKSGSDFVGLHKDRESDELLSVSLTIAGQAPVWIFNSRNGKRGPADIERTDEFITSKGSIMLLRANGLGNGERALHQVFPPLFGIRSVLNLRMRPDGDILKT